MYGWLLESVQHFIIQECGEEIWETILREAGARNTIFSATQQYPDGLMMRLASALVRLVTKDPNSTEETTPVNLTPKKPSLKSKQTWRSASVNADNRTTTFKCPFSATNALKVATKKEIDAYNSLEEVRAKTLSADRIHEGKEMAPFDNRSNVFESNSEKNINKMHRSSLGIKFENNIVTNDETTSNYSGNNVDGTAQDAVKPKRNSSTKTQKDRKNSLALDLHRRRGSVFSTRTRINSISGDKLSTLRERFGTPDKVMHFFGRCFVKFFSNYGYDTMIRATGRYFCTFLQSVDSIHQRMRYTFPRMRSPCMQLTRAHRHGAELVYSSTRTGFTHYLMGQLYEIAEDIFSLKLKATVMKESMEGSYYVAVLRLEFDNNDYVHSLMLRKSLPCPLPSVHVSLLLQLFPFGVLLDRRMKIVMAGEKLIAAWGGPHRRIEKIPAAEILRLRKPKVSFTWDKVVCMQTIIFELELMRWRARCADDVRRGSQGARAVLLKGPIKLLEEIDSLIFLCSPVFNGIEELSQAGLYLADLNGHGLSRELLMQGWDHLSRLDLLFERAETRSTSLEKSCRLLDLWKKKGDQLLYSMIPKSVVDHLRAGKDAMSACQAFDSVTIMFCGVQLASSGTRADVMHTVALMNDVYSKIDRLLDSHRVYKVETVGTVYMLVSGAPDRRRAHAASTASAALAFSRAIPTLTIGIHSGPCVAGVLGLKLPRYCLVGDTVNTASRMQTTSEPGRIQISATTASQLPSGSFRLRRRGLIKVKIIGPDLSARGAFSAGPKTKVSRLKYMLTQQTRAYITILFGPEYACGKGEMETFWLEGEVEEEEQHEALQLFSSLCGDN